MSKYQVVVKHDDGEIAARFEEEHDFKTMAEIQKERLVNTLREIIIPGLYLDIEAI